MRALWLLAVTAVGVFPGLGWAQDQGGESVVRVVATVETKHGRKEPLVQKGEVTAYQGRNKVKVEDWLPLRGDQAGLEFFILLDDAADESLGSQLDDLKAFILDQPATTSIGVGYMQNGMVRLAHNLSTDHDAVAKSLRLPMGGAMAVASPYFSLETLIKEWPATPVRREVLMVTDGIDRFGGSGPANPYVDETIDQALKAGILVYTIYTPGVGHYGHAFWAMNWGQNYLAEISQATGAESYFLGFGAPVSFAPWLKEISERLQNQYLATLAIKAPKKGEFERVKITTEVPNTEIITQERVFVPAAQ